MFKSVAGFRSSQSHGPPVLKYILLPKMGTPNRAYEPKEWNRLIENKPEHPHLLFKKEHLEACMVMNTYLRYESVRALTYSTFGSFRQCRDI